MPHRWAPVLALFICVPLQIVSEGMSAAHTAQLGDPCSEPGDCKVPNSECVLTDNMYWNRQNFCVCQTGFHPSTGFCVADSGSDGHSGVIKLDYKHNSQQTAAVTAPSSSSSNDDTTKNTSARSLLMTPLPPQNLLQGFHFGNRTQAIVSNIVEQLTHLRGQQPTDQMKERLETLGLPLLQPPQPFAREGAEENAGAAPIVPASGDSNGYYMEIVTPSIALGAGAFVSATAAGTISPSPEVNNASQPSSSTTTETAAPITSFNPFAALKAAAPPLPPPALALPPLPLPAVANSTSSLATNGSSASGSTATAAPTMGTVATLKSSSSNNNSPFLPPELPPFFTKNSPLRTTSSSTSLPSTTIPLFNVSSAPSASASSGNPDDPEARLALLRKVQNLIVKSSPLTQRPQASVEPTTPSLNALVGVSMAGAGSANSPSKAGSGSALAPGGNATQATSAASTASEAAATESPNPRPSSLPGSKSNNGPQSGGMKNLLNNLGLGKSPTGANPQPFPANPPTPPSPLSDFEPQQQVRSTLIDRLPNVDFYAVFRSAAENVIREYLGGVLTTTSRPGQGRDFDTLLNAASGSNSGTAQSFDKMLEKMVESKSGSGGVLLQVNNQGHHHSHNHHSHGPSRGVTPAPGAQSAAVAATSKPNVGNGPTTVSAVTRPRPPFIWRSTSPGGHAAHPLPRIVFTG